MPPKLSTYTEVLVLKCFDPDDVEKATRLLEDRCGNNVPYCDNHNEYQMERIRFSAIKLSKGDLKLLRQAIDLACFDWRDLFMAADFGDDVKAHEKWAKEILGV